ncbi:MAG: hypothetical protein ACPGYV_05030 [Phycisphaeraceae bacterium]
MTIAIGYGLAYHRHEVGVSPFHLSARLPGLDLLILLLTVVLPLMVGVLAGVRSGGLRCFVLPAYPVVIAMSLV